MVTHSDFQLGSFFKSAILLGFCFLVLPAASFENPSASMQQIVYVLREGFESGKFNDWTVTGMAAVSKAKPHTGNFSAMLGGAPEYFHGTFNLTKRLSLERGGRLAFVFWYSAENFDGDSLEFIVMRLSVSLARLGESLVVSSWRQSKFTESWTKIESTLTAQSGTYALNIEGNGGWIGALGEGAIFVEDIELFYVESGATTISLTTGTSSVGSAQERTSLISQTEPALLRDSLKLDWSILGLGVVFAIMLVSAYWYFSKRRIQAAFMKPKHQPKESKAYQRYLSRLENLRRKGEISAEVYETLKKEFEEKSQRDSQRTGE